MPGHIQTRLNRKHRLYHYEEERPKFNGICPAFLGEGRDWSADDVTRMAPDYVLVKSTQWYTKIEKIVNDMIERVEGIHWCHHYGRTFLDGLRWFASKNGENPHGRPSGRN